MNKWNRLVRLLSVMLLSIIAGTACAQGPSDDDPIDPGQIAVYTVQHMKFGAFSRGAGSGTINVSTSGSRSVGGSVIALNLGVQFCQAIFEIEGPTGSIISINNGPNATLTGSNGGSVTLQIGLSSPTSPFITTVPSTSRTQVHIGGSLLIPAGATPPGTYSGTFSVIFNQE